MGRTRGRQVFDVSLGVYMCTVCHSRFTCGKICQKGQESCMMCHMWYTHLERAQKLRYKDLEASRTAEKVGTATSKIKLLYLFLSF